MKACGLVKRRTIAREMCDAGRVLINGHEAKPSKVLRPGDHVALRFAAKSIALDVLALPVGKSIQKADVQKFYLIRAEIRSRREDGEWIKNLS